jgi:hypothetical protein
MTAALDAVCYRQLADAADETGNLRLSASATQTGKSRARALMRARTAECRLGCGSLAAARAAWR